MCVTLSLSLSLSYNNAPKFIGRDVLREKESVRCQKLQLFKGCLPNTPSPHTPLQVSSSRRNFIRAGFFYKLITPEGMSHYFRCVCVSGGGGGYWVWLNIFFEVHQSCLPPPPSTHAHTSRCGNICIICLQVYKFLIIALLFLHWYSGPVDYIFYHFIFPFSSFHFFLLMLIPKI